jgi:HAD superfamily hydrolase (TIGR01450 family)
MKKNQNLQLFANCQAMVCDFDGTLYLEDTPFPEAKPFLEKIVLSGRRLFYFTNNTSKSRKSYLDKLARLQFPVSEEMLITAADCTFHYLRHNNLFPEIYLIGNEDLHRDFQRNDFVCLTDRQIARGGIPKAVVLGFDTELTYAKIRTGYQLILQNIPYIATHADILCPMAHGAFIPDVGSFIEMFAMATAKRPMVMGKPTQHAVQTISDRAQLAPHQIAFVGDRLYTDIRMAMNFDMIGVLVLSGETSEEMLAKSPDQPRILVDGVGDLIKIL